MRVNLIGAFNVLRLVAAGMARTDLIDAEGLRGGSSTSPRCSPSTAKIGQAAHPASKGGMVGMTLIVARDLLSQGIRVNTIAPGLLITAGRGEPVEGISRRPFLQRRPGWRRDRLSSMGAESA